MSFGMDAEKVFGLPEAELTDIEAEALYTIAFSFYSREERPLPVSRDAEEEEFIMKFKLFNPSFACGPSIFQ